MIRIISIFFMFILLQPISVKAFDFNKVRNDTIEARFYDPLRRALHHARPARSLLSIRLPLRLLRKQPCMQRGFGWENNGSKQRCCDANCYSRTSQKHYKQFKY